MAVTVTRTEIASLVVLAAALVFGVVLGFVLAFGSGETDPWEERWAELGVEEAEFVFLGDMTTSEQAAIRAELRSAQVVFAEHFGAVTSDVTVYVSTDLEGLNEHIAEHGGGEFEFACGGTAPRGAVFLALDECAAEDHGWILAHEYFHMLQWEARGPGRNRLEEPGPGNTWLGWIVEGSAVYAHTLFSEALERGTLASRREGTQVVWSALGQAFPKYFSEVSGTPEESTWIYGLGFLAVDWLVDRRGPPAILEFFRLGAHGAAFETAFGISVASFHDAFERHRQEVAPPFAWRVAGTVVGPDGMPVEAVEVHIGVRIEGRLRSAASTETDSQGEFELSAPGSGYVLGLFAQCPGEDGTPEWAHAGEWGADGFVADADGSYEDEEDRAEPFADGERDRVGIVIELPDTRESLIAKGCEGEP